MMQEADKFTDMSTIGVDLELNNLVVQPKNSLAPVSALFFIAVMARVGMNIH